VEREWLAERLEGGASIEAIAREVGRHPSSVAYWVHKHGLSSMHAARHAQRGPIERELLAEIVACELSIREMADVLDRSPTTVRHWLRRHGLQSGPARRRAAVAAADRDGAREVQLRCRHHGPTRHVRRADGFRCARCEAERVVAWRRKVKRILVEEAGGACILCGFAECDAALQFLHHVDPTTKSFALSRQGVTRSLARAREEAEKCVLLCANCHAKVEAGLAQLPLRSVDRPVYPA
jgi:transposase-like protein